MHLVHEHNGKYLEKEASMSSGKDEATEMKRANDKLDDTIHQRNPQGRSLD